MLIPLRYFLYCSTPMQYRTIPTGPGITTCCTISIYNQLRHNLKLKLIQKYGTLFVPIAMGMTFPDCLISLFPLKGFNCYPIDNNAPYQQPNDIHLYCPKVGTLKRYLPQCIVKKRQWQRTAKRLQPCRKVINREERARQQHLWHHEYVRHHRYCRIAFGNAAYYETEAHKYKYGHSRYSEHS